MQNEGFDKYQKEDLELYFSKNCYRLVVPANKSRCRFLFPHTDVRVFIKPTTIAPNKLDLVDAVKRH